MIETITYNNELVAIIIRNDYHKEGINFFSPEDFPQQLGFVSHKAGEKVKPHIHKMIKREIYLTQEILYIKKGRVIVNFFTEDKKLFNTKTLTVGDTILLARLGHSFEFIEDTEMLEVKQGPYLGTDDKVRF